MTAGGVIRRGAVRWLKFNTVGAGGIAVQLATLSVLKSGFEMNFLAATALAVEAAIVHNYFCHQRFTWIDRSTRNSGRRFLKFNFTTGIFSILGNVVLMQHFVASLGMNYLLANMLTIVTCALVNFVVSDRFVFEEK